MTAVVGLLGPAMPDGLQDYLHVSGAAVPAGMGGTPVNLLVRALLERGREVVLFTLDPAVDEPMILTGPRLRICVGPWRRSRPARDFFAAERHWLTESIRREAPAVLHAHWTYEYALAAQASGLPHVITAHDAPIDILRHNPIPYRLARTFMAYRVLMRARRVVSVSPYTEQHLLRFMLYRGARQVIPNGMPASLFERQRQHSTAKGGVTFASVLSGWSDLKNPKTLIRAFHEVRRQLPEARLIMFGAGHGENESGAEWAREQQLADGIEFAGQLPYAELLKRLECEVDVLVHPSCMEAQPMSVIEAMALGIPVIGGKSSGGVAWTLGEGTAGILVDVINPSEVADAMMKLACDPDQRVEWAVRARELALRRFHIDAVVDAYESIYAELEGQR